MGVETAQIITTMNQGKYEFAKMKLKIVIFSLFCVEELHIQCSVDPELPHCNIE